MSFSERSSLLPHALHADNYWPERFTFGTAILGSTGGIIYNGYCLANECQNPGGWWAVGSLVTTAALSTFGFIRSFQHRQTSPIPMDGVRINDARPPALVDSSLTTVAEAVERVAQTLRMTVESSRIDENMEQRTLRILNLIRDSHTGLSEQLRQSRERVTTLERQANASSASAASIELPDRDQLALELDAARYDLAEYERSFEANQTLMALYQAQLQRLTSILESSSSSTKDMDEARLIARNLKEKSAESSAAASKNSTPVKPSSGSRGSRRVSIAADAKTNSADDRRSDSEDDK